MKILVIGKGTMGNLIFNSLKERYKNDKKTIIDNVSLDKDRIIKKDYDYIIDFSHPDSIKHYKYFLNQKTKIIIGTTNFNEEQEEYLLFLSKMNPIVKDVLLNTKDYIIAENCIDEDTDWGLGNNNQGNNYLGKIWMKIRDDIKGGNTHE